MPPGLGIGKARPAKARHAGPGVRACLQILVWTRRRIRRAGGSWRATQLPPTHGYSARVALGGQLHGCCNSAGGPSRGPEWLPRGQGLCRGSQRARAGVHGAYAFGARRVSGIRERADTGVLKDKVQAAAEAKDMFEERSACPRTRQAGSYACRLPWTCRACALGPLGARSLPSLRVWHAWGCNVVVCWGSDREMPADGSVAEVQRGMVPTAEVVCRVRSITGDRPRLERLALRAAATGTMPAVVASAQMCWRAAQASHMVL